MAMRMCAAAVCSAFSFGAAAQSAADQARTLAGQAMIDRAQSTGFLAGLDRALKTPLEVVWLRTAQEAAMWNEAALSEAIAGCGGGAKPREGCAVVGRTAWRYVFGGNGQFAPRPNEVARLVVSSLQLPEAPITTGKLDLSGTGRLYLITPASENARGTLAVVLAAGSTLNISDAGGPAIQIEIKAPEDKPLLLGNLATADINRMLSLLLKPGSVSASEASVDPRGRVALRSPGEVQLASILPGPGRVDAQPAIARARVEPAPAPQYEQLAQGLEARGDKIDFEALLVASLAPIAGSASGEILVNTMAVRAEQPALQLGDDFTRITAAMEAPVKAPLSAEQMLVASLAPLAGTQGGELLANAAAVRVERPALQLDDDFTKVAGVMEAPLKAPLSAEQVLVASLAPVAGSPGGELLANAAAVRVAPTELQLGDDFTNIAAVVESPVKATIVQPVQVAAAPPAPAEAKPAQSATTATDIARMRAEIDAEIERDQKRLAQQRNGQGGKRFVLGV